MRLLIWAECNFFDEEGAVVAASKASHVWRYPKGGLLAKFKETVRSLLY